MASVSLQECLSGQAGCPAAGVRVRLRPCARAAGTGVLVARPTALQPMDFPIVIAT